VLCKQVGVVRDLDQRFAESDPRGEPIGRARNWCGLGQKRGRAHGVTRLIQCPPGVALKLRWSTSIKHRPEGEDPSKSSTAMSRRRRKGAGDNPPAVVNISRRGHRVVDAEIAPDLLMEDSDEIYTRMQWGETTCE